MREIISKGRQIDALRDSLSYEVITNSFTTCYVVSHGRLRISFAKKEGVTVACTTAWGSGCYGSKGKYLHPPDSRTEYTSMFYCHVVLAD